MDILDFLKEEGISQSLLDGVREFRRKYPSDQSEDGSSVMPCYLYYGKEIWEAALTALLCGKNLLLAGSKATGKNVLSENLAAAFGRPCVNISFHINMDASFLIGTDTFADGKVTFRPGPVYKCAAGGGFGILDEINMARNEALAVLHSVLDFRHVIDIPGYERITVREDTRFIATMNHGYAGTRELNEALASRFVVIQMPEISQENLGKLIRKEFPTMKESWVNQFTLLFMDIRRKCENGELSSKMVDLRGLLDALELMEHGLPVKTALDMGIVNKSFEEYDRNLVDDMFSARISEKLTPSDIFAG